MKSHLRHPELWMKTSTGYKTSMETWAQGIVGNKASAWQISLTGVNHRGMKLWKHESESKEKERWVTQGQNFFLKSKYLTIWNIISHGDFFCLNYAIYLFFFLHRSPSFHVHQSRTVKDDLHALEFWLLFTSDTHFSLLYYRFIFANPWCLVPNHSS